MSNNLRLPPVFQPTTYRAFMAGADRIVATIRPTLGPVARTVAIQRPLDQRGPELLDNGGVIAKRIIQLPDYRADVGAMFVRDMLWRLQEQEGDGTATAAVLFQATFNEGVRLVAAGLNARRLQGFLEEGIEVILNELRRQTVPVNDAHHLAQVAFTVCQDRELSDLLGEIFDIVGGYGRLEIREGSSRGLEREYVEGIYWERGLLSRQMVADPQRLRSELEDAAIVLSDLNIQEPQQILPVLVTAFQAGLKRLLIVADEIADSALSLLLANSKPDHMQILAVKTPGFGREQQADFLVDAAVLCGGRPFLRATGDTFKAIRSEDFGRARRVWADLRSFGLIGGMGDPRQLRRHLAALRAAHSETDDLALRGKLHERIGRLMGGSATLRVGGVTVRDIEARKELAERTAAAVRGAMQEGVVPGGGVALLACRPALQRCIDATHDPEARAAYRILLRAVAEPLRTIVANAGYDPSDALAEVRMAGPDYGFDVLTGRVTAMGAAGITDPANVVKAATYAGLTSAALALTIDVMVHRTEQPAHATPPSPARRKRL
ncbi:MAG: 60 kDa chaperonin 2 [Chloroflexota bacterium]|nr:MAG: 60 kDa chaperonin 2 [Chloroflexota bacterium]